MQIPGDWFFRSIGLAVGTAPSSPIEGQVYYDSTAHGLKVYNNASAWVDVGGAYFAPNDPLLASKVKF